MPIRDLGELDQDVSGRDRVDEQDPAGPVARLRFFAREPGPLGLELLQRRINVLDIEAHVPDALPVLLYPSMDGRLQARPGVDSTVLPPGR